MVARACSQPAAGARGRRPERPVRPARAGGADPDHAPPPRRGLLHRLVSAAGRRRRGARARRPPHADDLAPVDRRSGRRRTAASPSSPPWLSEEELAVYVGAFERTGFTGGLNWYRNIDRNWELTEPFADRHVKQSAFFLTGELDPVRNFMPAEAMQGWVDRSARRDRRPGRRTLGAAAGARTSSTRRCSSSSRASSSRANGILAALCFDTLGANVLVGSMRGELDMNVVRVSRCLGLGGSRRCLVAALAVGALLLAASPGAFASTFERRPVLFVHGVRERGLELRLAGDALRKQRLPARLGRRARLRLDGGRGGEPDAKSKNRSKKRSPRSSSARGKSQVDVVGHSEGT